MLLLAGLLACADAAKDKSAAEVAPVPVVPAPAAPPVPAPLPAPLPGAEVLTPTGVIGFTGAKLTRTHEGAASAWKGELSVVDGAVARVWFEVEMGSVSTGIAKLDGHLKSADFFDVATMPTSRFVSTAIAVGAPANSTLVGATHTVAGDLLLHGQTRHLSFPAIIDVQPAEVHAVAEFFINRKDFGIVYPGKPDDLIQDEVTLKVDVRALRTPVTAPAATAP